MTVGDTYILDEKQGKSLNRIDTKTNWEAVNPVLAIGEMGIEKDGLLQNIKIGDGVTPWNSLQYMFKSCPYEVGDILVTMNETDPALRWPGTRWEAFAPGRVLIGAGEGTDSRGESKTFAVGDTGGEYNHQLTTEELAEHSHTRGTMNITGGGLYNESATYKDFGTRLSGAFYAEGTNKWGNGSTVDQDNSMVMFDASRSWTGATSSVGSNSAHGNIQPFLVVYQYLRLI